MNKNKIYDECFYINLERSPDRQKTLLNDFAKEGIISNRFNAIDKLYIDINYYLNKKYLSDTYFKYDSNEEYNKGNIAVRLSHVTLWEHIYKKYTNIKNVSKFIKKKYTPKDEIFLIFEDDAKILDNFHKKLDYYYHKFPDNWDMIWLGHGNLKGEFIDNTYCIPEIIKDGFYNSLHHCYLIKFSSIKKMIDILIPIEDDILTKDNLLKRSFNKFNAYFLIENLAVQNSIYNSLRLDTKHIIAKIKEKNNKHDWIKYLDKKFLEDWANKLINKDENYSLNSHPFLKTYLRKKLNIY